MPQTCHFLKKYENQGNLCNPIQNSIMPTILRYRPITGMGLGRAWGGQVYLRCVREGCNLWGAWTSLADASILFVGAWGYLLLRFSLNSDSETGRIVYGWSRVDFRIFPIPNWLWLKMKVLVHPHSQVLCVPCREFFSSRKTSLLIKKYDCYRRLNIFHENGLRLLSTSGAINEAGILDSVEFL